jgi:hypothetical protein
MSGCGHGDIRAESRFASGRMRLILAISLCVVSDQVARLQPEWEVVDADSHRLDSFGDGTWTAGRRSGGRGDARGATQREVVCVELGWCCQDGFGLLWS